MGQTTIQINQTNKLHIPHRKTAAVKLEVSHLWYCTVPFRERWAGEPQGFNTQGSDNVSRRSGKSCVDTEHTTSNEQRQELIKTNMV